MGSPQPFVAATEVKCWDFSSFVLLSEKRPNVVGSRSANCLRDTAAPCHGNPNQRLGLLILLVSFEKKTIMARDRILTITGESPRFGGTFLYGYSIAYFLRLVKSFVQFFILFSQFNLNFNHLSVELTNKYNKSVKNKFYILDFCRL